MNARTPRPVVVVAAAALALTTALSVAGMWLRAVAAPLWPSLLTDWSLGAALLALSSATVGTVLVTRIRSNVVGWLFLGQGLLTAVVHVLRQLTTAALANDPAATAPLWTAWGFAWLIPLNMTLLTLLLVLFPFGSPPSRRWRLVVAATVVAGAAAAVAAMVSPYLPDQTPFAHLVNPVAVLGAGAGETAVDITAEAILVSLLGGAVALVVRLARSRGTERQQMKWFVFAAIVAVTALLTGFWYEPLFVLATLVALPAVPVAAGVAVLRYRLYDIDRVINRTVVYGAVTGILALAYLTTVTGLRAATATLTGDSAVAVAASTLAVAALFRPVRDRIQRGVDRRFNRARYDAAATVAQLRLRLRDELDIESLKSELIGVVHVTMEPAGTALWLREAQR